MVEFSIQKTHLVYYLTYKVDHLYELVVVVLGITGLCIYLQLVEYAIMDHGQPNIEHQRNYIFSNTEFLGEDSLGHNCGTKNHSSWAPTKKLFKQKSPIITHIKYSSPRTLRLLAHLTSTQKKPKKICRVKLGITVRSVCSRVL